MPSRARQHPARIAAAVVFFILAVSHSSAGIQRIENGGRSELGRWFASLPNGNVVVVDPLFSSAGLSNLGSITLYRADGTPIQRIEGQRTGDALGSGGITVLANGHFVVSSPDWSEFMGPRAGAVTWGHAERGIPGTWVSQANSIVGDSAGDEVGDAGVVALPNGHYLVRSRDWDSPTLTDAGAITWARSDGSTKGAVTAANSIIGGKRDDFLHAEARTFPNGDAVLMLPSWDNGAIVDAGALVWLRGDAPQSGVVSAANALVGAAASDFKDARVTAVPNGHYALTVPFWDAPGAADAGAVLVVGANLRRTGPLHSGIAFTGANANDLLGLGIGHPTHRNIVALGNGDLAVISPNFRFNSGAVHRIPNSTAVAGVAGLDNAVTGVSAEESVGSGGVVPLANGGLVVLSPMARSRPAGHRRAGAVTIAPPGFGRIVLSATNSTFGRAADDQWGSGGAIELTDGRVLAGSLFVADSGVPAAGAISLLGAGSSGAIDPATSWFGSTSGSLFGGQDPVRAPVPWAALPNGEALVAVPALAANGTTRAGVLHIRADTPRGVLGTHNVQPMAGFPVATVALANGRFAAVFTEGLAFDVAGRLPADADTNPARTSKPRAGEEFFRVLALSTGRVAVLSKTVGDGSAMSLSTHGPDQPAMTVDATNSLTGLPLCYPRLAELPGGRFTLFSASRFAMDCDTGTHVLAASASTLSPAGRDWESADGDVAAFDGEIPPPPHFDAAAGRMTFGHRGAVVRMTLDGGNRPPRWVRPPTIVDGRELRIDAEAVDPDGDAVAYRYQWLSNGVPIHGANGVTYRPVALDRGTSISARVEARDGTSAIIVVVSGPFLRRNIPPSIETLEVTGMREPGQTLTIIATARDPDGDAVALTYAWRSANGDVLSRDATFQVRDIDAATYLTASASADDGIETSERTTMVWIGARGPEASDDRFEVASPFFHIQAPGVLGNDRNLAPADQRSVEVVQINGAAEVSIRVGADGSVRGRSNVNQPIALSFVYKVCNSPSSPQCSEATAEIAVPSMLQAIDDPVVLRAGTHAVTIHPLENDLVPQGQETPSLRIVSSTAQDRLVLSSPALRLTPSTDTTRPDVIRYEVCLRDGRCSRADLHVRYAAAPLLEIGADATRGQKDALSLTTRDGLEPHVSAYAPGGSESVTSEITLSAPDADPFALAAENRALDWHPLWLGRAGVANRFVVEATGTHIVGIDSDEDGRADPEERICSGPAVRTAHHDSATLRNDCEIDGRPHVGTDRRFWVLSYERDRFGAFSHEARVGTTISAVSLEETTAVGAWRKDERLSGHTTSHIMLSWDRSAAPRGSDIGFLRFRRKGGADEWVPFTGIGGHRHRPVAIPPGVPTQIGFLTLPAFSQATHFVDVPAGARSLRIAASADGPFGLHLIPADPPLPNARSPMVEEGPGIDRAIASGPDITLTDPAPGRYFVMLTAGSYDSPTVTVTATIDAAPPAFRPGSYFNPSRGGHGIFIYPAGDQWAALWYHYEGIDSTWYYAQAAAPGANGIWRSTLFRSTWKDGRNHLAPAGHLTLTPTAPDRATMAYTLNGLTGSEEIVSFGRGCPTIDGRQVDLSGHWFNPARSGTGYSVQLFPDYEFYIAFGYDAGGNADFRVAELTRIGPPTATIPLESLEGFCPHCERFGAPTRRVSGSFTRTIRPDGRIHVNAIESAGEPVGGTWNFDELVTPLGGLQGCER